MHVPWAGSTLKAFKLMLLLAGWLWLAGWDDVQLLAACAGPCAVLDKGTGVTVYNRRPLSTCWDACAHASCVRACGPIDNRRACRPGAVPAQHRKLVNGPAFVGCALRATGMPSGSEVEVSAPVVSYFAGCWGVLRPCPVLHVAVLVQALWIHLRLPPPCCVLAAVLVDSCSSRPISHAQSWACDKGLC